MPDDSGIIVCSYGAPVCADLLRYDPELVVGELTAENIEKNVIPKIKAVLSRFGKTDKDGNG